MAKVKTAESPQTQPAEEYAAAESSMCNDEPAVDGASASPADGKTRNPELELPPLVRRVLQAFRTYPELYVDCYGSTYTSSTPKKLRAGATLYKNPFYQP